MDIIDHVEQNVKLLPMQWSDKKVVNGLIKSISSEFNVVENLSHELLNKTGIYDAEGVFLDNIGLLFDEKRNARDDDKYRSAILSKILRLMADGTTENFMQSLRLIGNTEYVDFWEHNVGENSADADIHAYLGEGFGLTTWSQANDSALAGVSVRIMFDDKGDAFVPSELLSTAYDLQVNTLSDMQVGTGEVLQVNVSSYGEFANAILPEIGESFNPLIDLITKDSRQITGRIMLDDNSLLITQDDDNIGFETYEFIK